MRRPNFERFAEGLVEICEIVKTRVGTNGSVVARVRGADPSTDDDATDETDHEDAFQVDATMWGSGALLARPASPSTEGRAEALVLTHGDTREIVGWRDLRWQVSLERGEVVVRNLVTDAAKRATIKINQDGEVIIDSPKVYVGTASATEKIGLGTAIKGHFDAIKTFLDIVKTHTHPVSGATAGASVALSGGPPSVPGVESRHVVEGA